MTTPPHPDRGHPAAGPHGSGQQPAAGPHGAGSSCRVLIAGGGTGGHLFPGLAVAEALQRLRPGLEVRFAGSRYGIEHKAVPARGYKLYRIPVRGLFGMSRLRRLLGLARLPLAFVTSCWVLLSYRPHLVLGVGGYASGPVLATAWLLGRATALQEQNAYPGVTNRLLGRRVGRAFLAVEDRHGFFPRSEVVGNPVRRDILALREEPPLATRALRLFVFGGSQGAHVLNEAMLAALPRLVAWQEAGKAGQALEIVHQTGPKDFERVCRAYAEAGGGRGLEADVRPFVEDMAGAYRACRLVLGRSGASTVSELIAARRPAVLVPIPGSSGEHQLRNAQRLAAAGSAVVLEQSRLSGETLADTLLELLADPARLDAMEAATDALHTGDSAERIALSCLELMGA